MGQFTWTDSFKLEFPIKQETIHQARKVAVYTLLQSSSVSGANSPYIDVPSKFSDSMFTKGRPMECELN